MNISITTSHTNFYHSSLQSSANCKLKLSYSDANANGSINTSSEILSENNYYPFGLQHKGYNNFSSANANDIAEKWKFQGQELNDDFDLNWNSFKWRNYDASLARFHNIDPLAEDYSYQSPYNFSENRVVDGVELEGLEYVSAKDARLKIGTNGNQAGKILIKTKNMSKDFQRAFAKASNNYSTEKEIGLSGQISESRFIARRNNLRGRNLESSMKIQRDARLSNNNRFTATMKNIKSSIKGRAARGIGALVAIDFGFQLNDAISTSVDYFGIESDLGYIQTSESILEDYLSKNDIDPKFDNISDLSQILNVIFQGEIGKGGSLDHLILGLTIYNSYNNDKESKNRLEYYKRMQSTFNNLKDKDNEQGNN